MLRPMPDVTNAAPNDAIDEAKLRDPFERPIFLACVAGNILLMSVAIALIFFQPGWLKMHPLLNKEIALLRVLAITALIGIPLLVLNRNRREASIRGNSVRASEHEFPEVFAILQDHGQRLGLENLPELFITGSSIAPYSRTFSSWRENYIVLHQVIFDVNDEHTLDVVSFIIGHELGAIRLNQTAVWNEMLLTYISSIKWLRAPLERVRTYSRDRYGATLAPSGFRGLLIDAIGRRLMDHVNIEEYFAQERSYGSFWALVNIFFDPKPQVFTRLRKLHDAGYRYQPYRAEGT
jgi:hypothetical protein